jgi:amidase
MTADAFLAAEEVRSNVLARFARFFEDHDVLLTPAVSVMPFSNDQEDVLMIDGEALASQIDYLAITFIVSLIGWPCLSIPCHWTPDGIPLGMQIIVPPWQEARLFAVAAMLEARLGFRHRWPEEGARLTSTASDERGLPPAAGAPANPEVPT